MIFIHNISIQIIHIIIFVGPNKIGMRVADSCQTLINLRKSKKSITDLLFIYYLGKIIIYII